VEGQKYKISSVFDIPIDETTISNKVITVEDKYGKILDGKIEWDKQKNAAVFLVDMSHTSSSEMYTLKIDKVKDREGLQMEEGYVSDPFSLTP